MSTGPCSNCTSNTVPSWHLADQINTNPTILSPAAEYVPGQALTLLKLPPEVRERIWRYVFSLRPSYPAQKCQRCGYTPLQCLRTEIQHAPHKAANRSVLTSLRTCKMLNSEAGHLFYSLNTLSLSSPAALYHFLINLAPRQRESIVSLHVGNVTPAHWSTIQIIPQAFSLLSLCPRLEDFYLDFSVDEIANPHLVTLLRSVFNHGDAFWSQTEFDRATEYEEFIFCKGFLALSQQRNLARLGLRARYQNAEMSDPYKLMERCRPFAYEDVMYKTMNEEFVELLRAQVKRPRLKPRTRLERAQSNFPSKTRLALTMSPGEDHFRVDQESIRQLSVVETQLEKKFLKQKLKIRYIFEHRVTLP